MEYIFYYKITCLIVGFSIIFLGYKLFVKGVFVDGGNFEVSLKNNKLILKKALPGTYFVVLGTVIICFTIFKGLSSDDISRHRSPGTISQKHIDSLKINNDSIVLK
ncbi:hypothetical protein [Mucilaginibacter ginsenosidivorans]|uniref:hypothetical protein n=1 Tax=Mucilaginibacter ginsenosidivorans TaxID=398053 RepID=UPI0016527BF0|nr:hypothetical protein [Mucilaginibacter ginsenosidivorans]